MTRSHGCHITERVKEYLSVTRSNKVWLIPMIGSRTSNTARQRELVTMLMVHMITRFIVECVGVIMDLQVPLLTIDRRGVSIMSALFANRKVTHLRFVDA